MSLLYSIYKKTKQLYSENKELSLQLREAGSKDGSQSKDNVHICEQLDEIKSELEKKSIYV